MLDPQRESVKLEQILQSYITPTKIGIRQIRIALFPHIMIVYNQETFRIPYFLFECVRKRIFAYNMVATPLSYKYTFSNKHIFISFTVVCVCLDVTLNNFSVMLQQFPVFLG